MIFLGCVIQNQKIRCIVDTVLSSQKVVVSPLAVTLTGKTLQVINAVTLKSMSNVNSIKMHNNKRQNFMRTTRNSALLQCPADTEK